MTPIAYYEEQCQKGLIEANPLQREAVQLLDNLFHQIIQEAKKRRQFFSKFRRPRSVKGLYIWGSVGIGKTFMMDCFYQTLPIPNKMRIHFHAFMKMVHEELKHHQGKTNPLQHIAKKIAKDHFILCFDELVVNDITDAMLLGRLLKALFTEGVTLVATSNVKPDDLYKKGLQRQLFLPTIELIKHHTHVFHLTSTVDYRLRHLKDAGVFYTPNDAHAQENMEKTFAVFANGTDVSHDPISIHGREIPVIKRTEHAIWFDFNKICGVPRSQHDYLDIVKEYRTIFISNIPTISAHAQDRIALFIRLIDVLYDTKTRLIASSESPVEKIYTEGRYLFEYQRASSRLIEMQSENYFSQTK